MEPIFFKISWWKKVAVCQLRKVNIRWDRKIEEKQEKQVNEERVKE